MRTLSFIILFGLCCNFAFGQNSALSFDGVEEYLTIPHNDDYDVGDEFTVEAWIFAETWTDQSWQGTILGKDNQGPDRGYAFRCGADGALSFVMSVDNNWEEAVTTSIMNTNQWHHVAAVVDNGTITLYIDGQPMADHSFTGDAVAGDDLDLHISASAGFDGRFFDGVFDEIRIWDTARTQSEISDNATVDLTGSEDNLVLYLPFNEGEGTITEDLSSNGSTASLNEMDDTNWVQGYALPDYDVSVQSVFGIDVINMIDRPVKMSAIIQNTGVETISDIDLEVSIDGDLYMTETISNSIASGDALNYEFAFPIDLIGMTDPVITVEAFLNDDGNVLNNVGSLAIKTGSSNSIIVSDEELHNNTKQNYAVDLTLPKDLHRYEQMLLNIDLTCPSGGCGDWDVLADLRAVTSSGTYELARYITPYGVACGGWQVDITDFKSVLGGKVTFLTNITVYTATGWLVDMSIDLIDNNSEDFYSKISPMWEESYHVYGDPDIDDDLDAVALDVMDNTETNHVRMTITGHGQGNTNNAAEFYDVTHNLNIEGSPFADHHLWKADCSTNPCSPQSGNWQFPRAGWCPGEAVIPYIINTTSQASPGSTTTMDYELQDYTNLLNTGYNGSSHTEPYYRLYSYFIENSSTAYTDYHNLSADNVVVDYDGNGSISTTTLSITNSGLEDLTDYSINVYYEGELVASELFNETIAAGASIEQSVTINFFTNLSDALFVEVVNDQDDNPGDNVIKTSVVTSTNQLELDYAFEAFPNPTTDGQIAFRYDSFWEASTMNIYQANGVLIETIKLTDQNTSIQLDEGGMYFYTLTHPDLGTTITKKVVFVD